MNEDIKDMENWNQKFGDTFAKGLIIFFLLSFFMFFWQGCSYEGLDRNDKIVSPNEKEDADPSARVLFKQKDVWND